MMRLGSGGVGWVWVVVAVMMGGVVSCGEPMPGTGGGSGGLKGVARVDRTFYANGNVRESVAWRPGIWGEKIREGPSIEYFENGRMHLQAQYQDDALNGELKEWYADGTLARKGSWKHNRENGLSQGWQPTGEKAWEARYNDGKVVGEKTYWVGGRVCMVETYDRSGYLERVLASEAGGSGMEGHYRKGKKHGLWVYRDKAGKVTAEGEWREGKPWNGVCGIPVAGDAGSMGGLEHFEVYKEGVHVGAAARPGR